MKGNAHKGTAILECLAWRPQSHSTQPWAVIGKDQKPSCNYTLALILSEQTTESTKPTKKRDSFTDCKRLNVTTEKVHEDLDRQVLQVQKDSMDKSCPITQ